MITWNRIFFSCPSSYLIEIVIVMHDYVMILLSSILLITLYRGVYLFKNKKFNNFFLEEHQLESAWTIIPFVLLILILIPSLNSLYMLDACLFCGLSIRIIAHQWYWRYFYKDLNSFLLDSYILPSEVRSLRLVDVDNRLVLPANMPIRFNVTSSDVIHSWTIPSFGTKIDAIPGRLNQFCLSTKRPGVFFGQCSEICGANHRFIPIVVERVQLNDFNKNFIWSSSLI